MLLCTKQQKLMYTLQHPGAADLLYMMQTDSTPNISRTGAQLLIAMIVNVFDCELGRRHAICRA